MDNHYKHLKNYIDFIIPLCDLVNNKQDMKIKHCSEFDCHSIYLEKSAYFCDECDKNCCFDCLLLYQMMIMMIIIYVRIVYGKIQNKI
jgi:hypothetical protein